MLDVSYDDEGMFLRSVRLRAGPGSTPMRLAPGRYRARASDRSGSTAWGRLLVPEDAKDGDELRFVPPASE